MEDVKLFAPYLESESSEVRALAIKVVPHLSRVCDRRLAAVIMRGLRDDSADARSAALEVLRCDPHVY